MCSKNKKKQNTKTKKGTETQKTAKCGTVANAFVCISIVFTLTMSFLVVWPIAHNSKDIRNIQVNLSIPNDSLAVEKVLLNNDAQIIKLVGELNKQSQEITDKYNVLLKSQETESDFFRLVSCIAAFIVALFGFMGYKTIKDIEAKVQSMAKDQADETAKEFVSSHLEQEVESQLKDIVGDTTAANLLKEQLLNQMMPLFITPLESRIAKLESLNDSTNKEETQIEEVPTNAFSHKETDEIAKLTQEEGGEGHE